MPTTWFVQRLWVKPGRLKMYYSVMNNWGSKSCAISYGSIGKDLITLAFNSSRITWFVCIIVKIFGGGGKGG